MADSVSQQLDSLSKHFAGLAAAAASLEGEPEVAESVRRIARALETASASLGLAEVTAGAVAIQRAADAHLGRSVENFLARIDDLRGDDPSNQVVKILIVEDNKTVAAATRAQLQAPGRAVLVAETAGEAESMIEAQPIDLVVLDLILPDRDGRDLLVELRQDPNTANLPVIILSSTENPVAREECLAVGADAFLTKPAPPKLLRSAVSRHLDLGRRRRDAVRDGLTGLRNRAGLSSAYDEYRRSKKASAPFSVALVSLNSLAPIAIKLGRDAGDRFVLEACAGIHESLGPEDILGRWAIAELVVILPGRGPEEAKAFLGGAVDRLLRDPVLDEFRKAGIDIELTGGVAEAGPDMDLQTALSGAEQSLLSARPPDADPVRSTEDLVDLEKRTVLLVEDDRVTSTLIHHRLMKDGHEVVSFVDGAHAHRWVAEGAFDLAILDVKLPGKDGFGVLEAIRAMPHHADTPIIMLTGMGSEADVIRGLESGADDYMLKPFSPTELLARVRRLLHRDGKTEEATA